MMSNPLLVNYSVIILDEIHERSLMTDILMGLIKKVLKVCIYFNLIIFFFFNAIIYYYLFWYALNYFQKRPTLRLIILSATLDSSQLKSYFNLNQSNDPANDTATVLGIEGRSYPTKIYYIKGNIFKYIILNLISNKLL